LVTFEEFRDYCASLDGQVLQTEGRGKLFTVSVEGPALRFVPGSGKPRAASPDRTAKVLDLLAKTGDWSPARYRQITYHSSYILGVAKHRANVDSAGTRSQDGSARHTNDYCEVWAVTGWRRVPVSAALARPNALTRCIECHGAVRLHVAGPGGVPRAHAEHREGHEGCSLGHYFSGVRSPHPNAVLDPAPDSDESHQPPIAEEDDESAFPEGRETYALHRKLERDGRLPKRAKAARLANTGKLECEACAFEFAAAFGQLGVGFIEAHHRVPVHKLDGSTKTKAEDLALVCPNCHRMLHRSDPHLSVEELRDLLTARRCANAG
jgi:hypothetical protein